VHPLASLPEPSAKDHVRSIAVFLLKVQLSSSAWLQSVHVRQVDVQKNHIRLQFRGFADCCRSVHRFTDNLKLDVRPQQGAQSLSDRRTVIYEKNANRLEAQLFLGSGRFHEAEAVKNNL